jgi:hypothetical protein
MDLSAVSMALTKNAAAARAINEALVAQGAMGPDDATAECTRALASALGHLIDQVAILTAQRRVALLDEISIPPAPAGVWASAPPDAIGAADPPFPITRRSAGFHGGLDAC